MIDEPVAEIVPDTQPHNFACVFITSSRVISLSNSCASVHNGSHRLTDGRYIEPAEDIGTVLIAAQTRTGH